MSYTDLLVYRLAVTIQDGSALFCEKFLTDPRYRRTVEQMDQANRSCKQNIVEGVSEKSYESQLKLIGVSRASYNELLEDFKDYLRLRKLALWDKNDLRVLKIRAYRESVGKETNLANLSNWSNLNLASDENFANIMICLIHKESYLVDQLSRAIEKKFVEQGGFRESLLKKRMEYKRQDTNKTKQS